MGQYVCVCDVCLMLQHSADPPFPPLFNERSDRSRRPKTKYFSATRIIAPALKRGGAARKSCNPLLEYWICIYCITLLTH